MPTRARSAVLAAAILLVALLAGCQGPTRSCDPIVYGDLPCL